MNFSARSPTSDFSSANAGGNRGISTSPTNFQNGDFSVMSPHTQELRRIRTEEEQKAREKKRQQEIELQRQRKQKNF